MARTSIVLTVVVSVVLGIAIGVVGVSVLGAKLSPTASTVANQLSEDGKTDVKPQAYGNR
jgi:hypothetical protein